MLTKEQVQQDINRKANHIGIISVGVTWVDGRIVFREDKKWAKAYYAICHYSKRVWLMTPIDWEKSTMLATIYVSPSENYCEKAYMCLNFKCPFNRFDKKLFASEFDAGEFTLGLPLNLGSNPLWFNTGKFIPFFEKLIISPEGGVLRYSEEKLKRYLNQK